MREPVHYSTKSRFYRMLWMGGLVVAAMSQWATAANILVVGGTEATDDTFQAFLEGKGHTVSNTLQPYAGTTPSAMELDAADLVIVSRSINSGNYIDDAGLAAAWNAIDKPMLLMSSYLIRTSRWGWVDTTAVNGDVAAPTDFNAYPAPSHPFVDGLTTSVFPSTFDGGNPMDIDWGGTASQVPAGSTVVATMTVGAEANALGILDIPAGTTLFADNEGTVSVTPQRRVFFQMNDYVDEDDVFVLSENGGAILNNILNELSDNPIVPGDVNGNGIVDIDDYYIIEDHFQQNVTMRSEGDLNNDGIVDFADFRQWKSNRTDVGSGNLSDSTIPEPSGLTIIAFLGAGIAVAARARSRPAQKL